jgi:hypothetical protein
MKTTQIELNKLYSEHMKTERKLQSKIQQLRSFSCVAPEYKKLLDMILQLAADLDKQVQQIKGAK